MSTHSTTATAQSYQSPQEPERLFDLAGFYWKIMLTTTCAVIVAAVVGGAYMLVITFMQINDTSSTNTPPQSLNRAQLAKIIQNLQERQAMFMSVGESAVQIADPFK